MDSHETRIKSIFPARFGGHVKGQNLWCLPTMEGFKWSKLTQIRLFNVEILRPMKFLKVGFSGDVAVPLEQSQRQWFVKLEWRGLDVTCGKLCLLLSSLDQEWLGLLFGLSFQGSLMFDRVFVSMCFFEVLVVCDHFMLLFPFSRCFRMPTVMICDEIRYVSARLSIFFTCTAPYVFYLHP